MFRMYSQFPQELLISCHIINFTGFTQMWEVQLHRSDPFVQNLVGWEGCDNQFSDFSVFVVLIGWDLEISVQACHKERVLPVFLLGLRCFSSLLCFLNSSFDLRQLNYQGLVQVLHFSNQFQFELMQSPSYNVNEEGERVYENDCVSCHQFFLISLAGARASLFKWSPRHQNHFILALEAFTLVSMAFFMLGAQLRIQ